MSTMGTSISWWAPVTLTSADETQPPLQSSPADEINHHTVIGVVDPRESAVLLAAESSHRRSGLGSSNERLRQDLSARPFPSSRAVSSATRSVWERMRGTRRFAILLPMLLAKCEGCYAMP